MLGQVNLDIGEIPWVCWVRFIVHGPGLLLMWEIRLILFLCDCLMQAWVADFWSSDWLGGWTLSGDPALHFVWERSHCGSGLAGVHKLWIRWVYQVVKSFQTRCSWSFPVISTYNRTDQIKGTSCKLYFKTWGTFTVAHTRVLTFPQLLQENFSLYRLQLRLLMKTDSLKMCLGLLFLSHACFASECQHTKMLWCQENLKAHDLRSICKQAKDTWSVLQISWTFFRSGFTFFKSLRYRAASQEKPLRRINRPSCKSCLVAHPNSPGL